MTKEKGAAPSHNVIACWPEENRWYEIGVAWKVPTGGLSIRFNPFVDLARLKDAGVMVKPRFKENSNE